MVIFAATIHMLWVLPPSEIMTPFESHNILEGTLIFVDDPAHGLGSFLSLHSSNFSQCDSFRGLNIRYFFTEFGEDNLYKE